MKSEVPVFYRKISPIFSRFGYFNELSDAFILIKFASFLKKSLVIDCQQTFI